MMQHTIKTLITEEKLKERIRELADRKSVV